MGKKHRQRQYKPFRSNLRALWREFKRCGDTYPTLYHDRLMAWSANGQASLSAAGWKLFVAANPEPSEDDDEWWKWELMPTPPGMGRYWGNPDGLYEFEQLAKSAAIVFQEMEIIARSSCEAWLSLLHDVAFRQQLPLLRSDLVLWGVEDYVVQDFDEHVDEWHSNPDGIREYPLHPCQWVLGHNVFTSSMILIEAILDPSTVLLTSSTLDDSFNFTILQPHEPVQENAVHPLPESSRTQSEISRTSGNVFKQTETGTWHLRYVEDGVVEDETFKHQVGWVICHQLLASSGGVIRNKHLGDPKSRGQFSEGASVISETDLVSTGSADSDDGTIQKSWTENESRQDVASEEEVLWMKAQKKGLKEEIQAARIAKDRARLKQALRKMRELRELMQGTLDDRGEVKVFGTTDEKHRIRVAKALVKCRATLEQPMPRLRRFLKSALQSQGAGMSYIMAGEVLWET